MTAGGLAQTKSPRCRKRTSFQSRFNLGRLGFRCVIYIAVSDNRRGDRRDTKEGAAALTNVSLSTRDDRNLHEISAAPSRTQIHRITEVAMFPQSAESGDREDVYAMQGHGRTYLPGSQRRQTERQKGATALNTPKRKRVRVRGVRGRGGYCSRLAPVRLAIAEGAQCVSTLNHFFISYLARAACQTLHAGRPIRCAESSS